MALYLLAIRLIELGLGKNIDKLCREYEDGMSLQTSDSFAQEYEVASFHIETLSREVGVNYSYAAHSCLKFKFQQPAKKSFENPQFRKAFFSDVVAPVQALLDATREL